MGINILAVLDLSTAHLKPETVSLLDDTPAHLWPVSGGHIPYGYFMYAHDENMGDPGIPDDLWACIEFARANGCSHLRFDCDADSYEGLPVYEH